MLALQNFKTLIEEGFNEIVADSDDFRVARINCQLMTLKCN